MRNSIPAITWSKILALLIFVAFITLVIFLDRGKGSHYVEIMMSIPYGDKIAHFFIIGSLSFFLNLAMNFRRISILNKSFLLANILLIAFMALEELTQAFNPYRHFELSDMMMNNSGIMVFSYLAGMFSKHKFFGAGYLSEY